MVSIIIPYIDEYDYLKEALSSALMQQEIDLEIIVVCNAATIPEGYYQVAEAHQHVRFIHEPRQGSAYARNAGLQAANGTWVQYLDVDDLLLPNKISRQLQALDSDVIVSPHRYRYLTGKEEKAKWLSEDIWIGLLNSGLGATSAMLWKRNALLEVNGWNPGFSSHQEYELLFRMIVKEKQIVALDHTDTIVRQRRGGSITDMSQPVRAIEGIRLRELMWYHLVHINEGSSVRYEAFRQYIFKQLRGYYRRQPSSAMYLYKKYFSSIAFIPRDMHIPGYATLYKWLGFERTEKLISSIIGKNREN